ncbi:hypothetical protein GCM10009067_41790 [Haloarcula sebkhae]|uniref:Uncharacterized protein n=1 Tax=Haloarcula sebkhae TaxID=932660 RepID=A0A830F4M7_9EURY|nr:hypothetical protein GCM10009067_41790 [Haloarcula sebkhae]
MEFVDCFVVRFHKWGDPFDLVESFEVCFGNPSRSIYLGNKGLDIGLEEA